MVVVPLMRPLLCRWSLATRLLPLLAALPPALLSLAVRPAVAASPPAPAGLEQCSAPEPGRYVLLGSGEHRGEPVALLIQERWLADGRLEGMRFRRQGRRFSEEPYTGLWRADANCWATVERRSASGVAASVVALNRQGRPQASLVLAPEEVLSLRYVQQRDQACQLGDLQGLVTSQQQGKSWQAGRWQPNAVVQREWWENGIVQGWAVSSYGGQLERAGYSGRLELGEDCLGTMTQRDSLGNTFNYRVVKLSGRGGYFYLQADPDNLTLGLLQQQP
jgi:hypothetical protein